MSLRISAIRFLNGLNAQGSQRGVSGVTVAVILAAIVAVSLTVVQAATSGDSSAAQTGIPGLIG